MGDATSVAPDIESIAVIVSRAQLKSRLLDVSAIGCAEQSEAHHFANDAPPIVGTSYDPVKDGPASQSYGLQVASLAGVPRSVIDKAKAKLRHLEDHAYLEQQSETGVNQLDLFSSKECHPAVGLLENMNPDELSPRQALELLYQLKGMV